MKIFLCWSGPRSKQVAEFLKKWIKKVIQTTDPWISTEIGKGNRWNEEVRYNLEKSKIGIICLTKDNLDAKWILFESGAISKTKDAIVITFLLDIEPSDIEQPLAQFQHTLFKKDDIKKLVNTINKTLKLSGKESLDEKMLDEIFEKYYSELSNKLSKIKQTDNIKEPIRNDRELIEEILNIVRDLKYIFARNPTQNIPKKETYIRADKKLQEIYEVLKNMPEIGIISKD